MDVGRNLFSATIGFLHCNMRSTMLPRMPATHLLRACLLILGLVALLPLQVQDAGAVVVTSTVVRDCAAPCGMNAKAGRPDAVRKAATIGPAAGPSLPDDGFVPIPSIVPALGAQMPRASFRAYRSGRGATLTVRLDRPPKSA